MACGPAAGRTGGTATQQENKEKIKQKVYLARC